MYKNRSILAIIPARDGSKGLPGKNIRNLLGKPLIAWTIGQAKASKYIDKVVVSTDSRKIARVARKYKADIPFLRPKRLSTSRSKMIDVLTHALNFFKNRDSDFDLVILLQPTSPLRGHNDIDEAIRLFFRRRAKAVVSVCENEHPALWSNTLNAGGRMDNFKGTVISSKNRQEFPVYHRLNGAIYIAHVDYLLKNKGFLGKETYAYIMPSSRSVDIDDAVSFDFARFLMNRANI